VPRGRGTQHKALSALNKLGKEGGTRYERGHWQLVKTGERKAAEVREKREMGSAQFVLIFCTNVLGSALSQMMRKNIAKSITKRTKMTG